MQTIYTLTEAVALAIKAETQLDKSKAMDGTRNPFDNNRETINKGKTPMTPLTSTTQPFFSNTIRGTSSSGAPTKPANTIPPEVTPMNPYARPGLEKCYRCGQPGHCSNQCPRRSIVNLIEPEEEYLFDTEKDDNEAAYTYEEEEVTEGDEGELLSRSLVVQQLLLTPKQEEPSQWHNIFRTRCTVNKRVCDIIIDSGSSENIISKVMVTKLGLQARKHSTPYKIGWIKCGAKVKVTEVWHIKFSIEKNYADEVTCDVLEMDACHIILGCPWQYDVDAIYKGRDNVYIFIKRGLKVVLGPIKKEFSNIKPKPQGKPVLLVDGGKFMEETKEAREIFVVVVRGEVGRDSIDIPPILLPLLEEFQGVMPLDLPNGLPPVWDIQHQIDFTPGASLPNRLHYRMNPKES